MKRLSMGMVVFLGLSLVVTAAQAAGGSKKRKGKRAKKDEAPTSAQIAPALGDIEWGMTQRQLTQQLINRVKETYRPLVAKTRDVVEEDRLREEARVKIKAIKDSLVEFDGRSTGWDASFLRNEFTHNNGEAMLVTRDENSQNYFFFIDGKLWKWYKAFEASAFKVRDFKGFSRVVQGKFGRAKRAKGKDASGRTTKSLEWQDADTSLRAVDQTRFYGFYSLVFAEKQTQERLAVLRTEKGDRGPKRHALVDSVVTDEGFGDDQSPDIVDRITGKRRARREVAAPAQSAKGSNRRKAGMRKRAPEPKRSTSDIVGDDDPLKGLGI